jgi:hypothetical protein
MHVILYPGGTTLFRFVRRLLCQVARGYRTTETRTDNVEPVVSIGETGNSDLRAHRQHGHIRSDGIARRCRATGRAPSGAVGGRHERRPGDAARSARPDSARAGFGENAQQHGERAPARDVRRRSESGLHMRKRVASGIWPGDERAHEKRGVPPTRGALAATASNLSSHQQYLTRQRWNVYTTVQARCCARLRHET